jgi:pimeloyl-ACP methyl ester carboxylesterase
MSKQTKPSIVFCHGIWADGSCFNKVIPALQAEGYEVIAAQYGLDTPEEDVATVKRTLGRVSSPAILVGHSYGGSVITAAGTDERVAGLVYIAALAPDADETSQSQQAKFPVTDVFRRIEVADGRVWLRPEGVECFAGDLSEQEQKIVYATHYAPAADLFSRNALVPLGNRGRPGTSWPTTTARFTRICNASQRSVWVHPSTLSTAATFRCCPTPASSSMLSAPRQKQFMDHPLQPEPRLGDFRREQNRILPEGEKIATAKVFHHDSRSWPKGRIR